MIWKRSKGACGGFLCCSIPQHLRLQNFNGNILVLFNFFLTPIITFASLKEARHLAK